MSRFKFFREFDEKIKKGKQEDVLKVIGYCRVRLQLSSMKEHQKHWRKLLREAEEEYSRRFEREDK